VENQPTWLKRDSPHLTFRSLPALFKRVNWPVNVLKVTQKSNPSAIWFSFGWGEGKLRHPWPTPNLPKLYVIQTTPSWFRTAEKLNSKLSNCLSMIAMETSSSDNTSQLPVSPRQPPSFRAKKMNDVSVSNLGSLIPYCRSDDQADFRLYHDDRWNGDYGRTSSCKYHDANNSFYALQWQTRGKRHKQRRKDIDR